jgi:hypothetical protein
MAAKPSSRLEFSRVVVTDVSVMLEVQNWVTRNDCVWMVKALLVE